MMVVVQVQNVPKRTILVVEDNPIEQQIVSLLASRCGLDAEVVPTGFKAIEKITAGGYAAVLMNYRLPVMDGPECAARIRELESSSSQRTPIIAVTARVMDGAREECLEAGMDDYLSKPYSVAQFEALIGRWVAPGEVGN